MKRRKITALDERFDIARSPVLINGAQALVRLLLLQSESDRVAGLNTAGFVSGYRGSPLGGLDRELWRAAPFLEPVNIRFEPGLNEDLAATAVWGSQQANVFSTALYDGVFGLWYGKSPGVDRSGDALRHGNLAGTSRYGGVIIAAGDDPAAKSSTTANQSEFALVDAMIPVLAPASIGDILEFGLRAWAMSRYSGLWTGLKILTDHADASQNIDHAAASLNFAVPEFELPADGVSIRWPDPPLVQEQRLLDVKLPAALAFAAANPFDRVTLSAQTARIGICAVGKSWTDTMEALRMLGIGQSEAEMLGLRVYKVGMSWPLEPNAARDFAQGLEEVVVIEEKRPLVEAQLKEQAYSWPHNKQPVIVGKTDAAGRQCIAHLMDLDPAGIALALAPRLARFGLAEHINARAQDISAAFASIVESDRGINRLPAFCSGCPHNTSTKLPEGSRAGIGIGCHGMIMADPSQTQSSLVTQMGGEGANWIGQAPFVSDEHVFQNIGDGTYAHSGSLAIRAAIAANRNITFKLLYNEAVAMTGGQPVEGKFSVAHITRQLEAEGVAAIVVATNELKKYRSAQQLAANTTIRHRDELDAVQRELRDTAGVTVLIYDQTCATELRRRRKRGFEQDPDARIFINERVCEGCGDCGVQSNCMSITAVETDYGRKRAINQSSCNKDYSCIKGFCPSFVSVTGVRPKQADSPMGPIPDDAELREPVLPAAGTGFNVLLAGIGGTGVVTISAILATAAHLDGKFVVGLDQTGLAQKYGSVLSHVRISDVEPADTSTRIPLGQADLLLGCDLLTTASRDALMRADPQRCAAVVNTHREMPSAFRSDRDAVFPEQDARRAIEARSREGVLYMEASRIVERVFADTVFANALLLGIAWQRGYVPVSRESLTEAITLNAAAVENNLQAFRLGRAIAEQPTLAAEILGDVNDEKPQSLDDIVAQRQQQLAAYQNEAYATRYRSLVDRVRQAEHSLPGDDTSLTTAVAHYFYKLMAYKDEYEVARLYTDSDFEKSLHAAFDGKPRLTFHLSPPLIARRDPLTGRPRKYEFGSWMMPVFRLLARLKFLRGTPFDPFSYTSERKSERELIDVYERMVNALIAQLDATNVSDAVALASEPDQIRGFGYIKEPHLHEALTRWKKLTETIQREGLRTPEENRI